MSFLLALLRFCLCAWVGAAVLFVITGIREIVSPRFQPATKNLLAAVRFPAYYCVGLTLIGTALVCAVLQYRRCQSRSMGNVLVILPALAVLLMIVDWFFVFSPLLELMNDPDARERPGFTRYHNWSMSVNAVSVGLCAVSAVISLRDIRFSAMNSVSQNRRSVV